MRAGTELYDERSVLLRAAPRFAVDQHFGISRLHAQGERSKAVRGSAGAAARPFTTGTATLASTTAFAASAPADTAGDSPSIDITRPLTGTGRRVWARRRRLAGSQRFHGVLDVERLARLQIEPLRECAVSGQVHLDFVITGLDVQPLEDAVEVVDRAGEVAVHEDLRLPRRHLEAYRPGSVVAVSSPPSVDRNLNLVVRPVTVITVVPRTRSQKQRVVKERRVIERRVVIAADENGRAR